MVVCDLKNAIVEAEVFITIALQDPVKQSIKEFVDKTKRELAEAESAVYACRAVLRAAADHHCQVRTLISDTEWGVMLP